MEINELVEKYKSDRETYLKPTYNETQVRNDFIDPLLKCLGWDVDNEKGKTQFLRDVIQEEYIEVEDESSKKNPDYTLRINGTRKLFVEVKKPSVNILKSSKAAFQTRRYGWSANLGISVLTNFENIVIYDCRFKPEQSDNEHVARYKIFSYDQFADAFEEIKQMISLDAANSGALDSMFAVDKRIGQTFDEYFLQQIESWRERLAVSAINKNQDLNEDDINYIIQRLLNRIIFLRICEDRTIEKYETLKGIKNYDELKNVFIKSDKKFNSGLFDFIEDTISLNVDIDADVLIEIFNELYFPLSPYDFSVVDPTILSQIYERFLGRRITIEKGRKFHILESPEVYASNGVVPTPKIIVEQIVQDTLTPLIEEMSFEQLCSIKVADICCGSGTFLISAYDFILKKVMEKAIEENINNHEIIHQMDGDLKTLTLKAKREILENTIYGVDINPYAAEVTEFSLLLKLLEGENEATVESFINRYSGKILPSLKENIKCGNSVVDSKFYKFMPETLEDDQILYKVKPFDWQEEFPFLIETNGFDAIVGNPPYVRIQNLQKYSPEEIKYYQSTISGYGVAKKATIDKYFVFIQRALELLNRSGYLGYIIPHKFFLTKGGKELRDFITSYGQLSKIIHFGVAQVFPERSTYTAVLILQKEKMSTFKFKRIKKISPETLADTEGFVQYKSSNFNSTPWVFLSPETEAVFNKFYNDQFVPLKEVAEITVGLQTSADKIYIFEPEEETQDTFIFTKSGEKYEVEKGICLSAIYDLSFGLFDTVEANAQMIFPYTINGTQAELLIEEDFKTRFPLAWTYLNKFKGMLEKRSLQGKTPKWYQFGRSQSLAKFHHTPKLIWSVLATEAPYGIDKNDLQFTGGGNGPYYALLNKSKHSLLYFLGILSHPLIENMVKSGASEFRGEYYSHGKQFIENLPIRKIDFNKADEVEKYDFIVKTVENLIKTKIKLNKANYGAKRTVLRRKENVLFGQLVQVINDLYEINDEEFQTVMNDEMFTTKLGADD
ncbi:Eco57I restriction-modification methylase domain-containing protein [Cytobacillus kochii]|uniref:Eco57I restriction-modification methylase domain-containing protein n=1 Tax=Cytobacillus kochii TaxID=859143 RepID=UPI0025A07B9D|nr:N-6 DNA methylase [Cytobacillus kochii]MDM5209817.1 Eco57I restriction-modification methylase domain-containing protein [Cytobacillus kochii]